MEPKPLGIYRRDAEAEDLISGLPDEILHTILVRLPSAAAAARTSVLSRRWRGVWARMPELVLGGSPAPAPAPSPSPTPPPPSSALLDSIDAALNSFAAPTLHSLKIQVSGIDRRDLPADRVAPWLRFASQRLAGKLDLSLSLTEGKKPVGGGGHQDIDEELALPVCERATEIELKVGRPTKFVLRPPPSGSFSALTDLKIGCPKVDGGELGRFVSSPRCPCLRKLRIFVSYFAPVSDISICSESLECLDFTGLNTGGNLKVNAPTLQRISVARAATACIVAPKLESVEWTGKYNPGIHQFSVARRHIQSLYVMHSSFLGMLISSTRLMARYDTVKELKVCLGLYKKTPGYFTFLKEMDKLPLCESLFISFLVNHHALQAVMLHLLRKCICIRKLKLSLPLPSQLNPPKVTSCSISDCPCLLPDNYRLDDISFDSLEEIGVDFFTGSDEQEQFMKLLLSKCNTVTLKRVDIRVPFDPVSSEIIEVIERIHSVCHPNSKAQFNVLPTEVPNPFPS